MKIKREINGVSYEFELTPDEMYAAYEQRDCADIARRDMTAVMRDVYENPQKWNCPYAEHITKAYFDERFDLLVEYATLIHLEDDFLTMSDCASFALKSINELESRIASYKEE